MIPFALLYGQFLYWNSYVGDFFNVGQHLKLGIKIIVNIRHRMNEMIKMS